MGALADRVLHECRDRRPVQRRVLGQRGRELSSSALASALRILVHVPGGLLAPSLGRIIAHRLRNLGHAARLLAQAMSSNLGTVS